MSANFHIAGAPNAIASPMAAGHKKDFLVFSLGNREYGINLEKVQELGSYHKVVCIADAPELIAGMLTLRSRRVPVVDLHTMLGSGMKNNSSLADVIIINSGDRINGIAVDQVIDVVTLGSEQIKTSHVTESDYVTGVGTLGQRVMVLLDAKKLMTDFQPGAIETIAA